MSTPRNINEIATLQTVSIEKGINETSRNIHVLIKQLNKYE